MQYQLRNNCNIDCKTIAETAKSIAKQLQNQERRRWRGPKSKLFPSSFRLLKRACSRREIPSLFLYSFFLFFFLISPEAVPPSPSESRGEFKSQNPPGPLKADFPQKSLLRSQQIYASNSPTAARGDWWRNYTYCLDAFFGAPKLVCRIIAASTDHLSLCTGSPQH